MRANEEKDVPGKEVLLKDIEATDELSELNQLLTRSMAERKIQALIKGRKPRRCCRESLGTEP